MARRFIFCLLIFLASGTSAGAVPAPMSPEELFAASNLVALVRVLSVTCVAIIHGGSEELRRYTAELGLLRIRKGKERWYDVVTVGWEETPAGMLGAWYVAYYPGGKGWAHLQGQDGAYETTWWNGADDWRHRGRRNLPKGLMQTRRANLLTGMPFLVVKGLRWLARAGWDCRGAQT